MGSAGSFAVAAVFGSLAFAGAQTPLTTVRVASGLDQPLFVTHAPGDYNRIFILEQSGGIRILKHGVLLPGYFLDADPVVYGSGNNPVLGERGLLGMAFHPDYPNTNAFYINYSDNLGDTVVAKYSVSANPDVANPAGDIILFIDQPEPNHNGGWLGFGPDGYLYIAMGDGGGQQDPSNRGQTISGELLGAILRIDVSGDDFPADPLRDYAIPPSNPFVGIAGEDEIWAYGFRNPWRNAFDSLTGDFYIADVGQQRWEELNIQPAMSPGGENYGWDCFEGNECTNFNICNHGCSTTGFTMPQHVYFHNVSPYKCAITGGEVYRGCAIPDLAGTYFFADFCSDEIWSLRYAGGQVTELTDRKNELSPGNGLDIQQISGFGRDAAGEIYICESPTSLNGEVFKIVPDPPLAAAAAQPPHLSVDARTPLVDGAPVGWNEITFTFADQPFCVTENDFSVSVEGGALGAPAVEIVKELPGNAVYLMLNTPIEPLAWTAVYHYESMTTLRLGYLPGDVDASRRTTSLDILSLIDEINSPGDLPIWSVDIDRSGEVNAEDVTMLIALFEGAVGGESYLGASLP